MWSSFVAGAETDDSSRQEWVAERFQELWAVEPWGLIRGALGVLEDIWAGRRGGKADVDKPSGAAEQKRGRGDWIGVLRDRGADWLIL